MIEDEVLKLRLALRHIFRTRKCSENRLTVHWGPASSALCSGILQRRRWDHDMEIQEGPLRSIAH